MKNSTLLLVGILVVVVAILVNSQATPSNTASAPLVDEPAIEDVPFFGGGDSSGGGFGGGGSSGGGFFPLIISGGGHHHHHHRHPHPGPKPPPGPSCGGPCQSCVSGAFTHAQAVCCKAHNTGGCDPASMGSTCCDRHGKFQRKHTLTAGKNAGNKLGGQHRRGGLHAHFVSPHHHSLPHVQFVPPQHHLMPHANFVPPQHHFVTHSHPSVHFAPDRTHNAFYSHH